MKQLLIALSFCLLASGAAQARGFNSTPPEYDSETTLYDDYNALRPTDEDRVRERINSVAQRLGGPVVLIIDDAILENTSHNSAAELPPSLSEDRSKATAPYSGISLRTGIYADAYANWLASRLEANDEKLGPHLLILAESISQRLDFVAYNGAEDQVCMPGRSEIERQILVPDRESNRRDPDANSRALASRLIALIDAIDAKTRSSPPPATAWESLEFLAKSWRIWAAMSLALLVIIAVLIVTFLKWKARPLPSRHKEGFPITEPEYRLGGHASGGAGLSVSLRSSSSKSSSKH